MRKTVCVDLDGVLADYSEGWKGVQHFGEPLPGAVEFTKKLGDKYGVVIFTCRASEEINRGESMNSLVKRVEEWLDRHGFHYDYVFRGQGKPIAMAYIDDRAELCEPMCDSEAFTNTLARLGILE